MQINNVDFIVKTQDGRITEIFKNVKGIFKKNKLKKVSSKELFTFTRTCFEKDRQFIIPSISGITKENYLSAKASYGLFNNFSDFNQRTVWSFTPESNVYDMLEEDGQIFYVGKIKGKIVVKGEDGRVIFEGMLTHPYASPFKMSAKCVELLFQNATNGVYQTARDLEAVNKELNELSNNKDRALWICESCGEKFNTLDEFFCHLIEEKHWDSILECHPYDKECTRVRSLIEEK